MPAHQRSEHTQDAILAANSIEESLATHQQPSTWPLPSPRAPCLRFLPLAPVGKALALPPRPALKSSPLPNAPFGFFSPSLASSLYGFDVRLWICILFLFVCSILAATEPSSGSPGPKLETRVFLGSEVVLLLRGLTLTEIRV